MLAVELWFEMHGDSQTGHEESHEQSGDGHQWPTTIFLDQSSANKSASNPDDASDDGGDVGVGGHSNVTEHIDGVEDNCIAARQLLKDEDK